MTYADTIVPIMREIRPMILPYWGKAGTVTAKSASPVDLVTELDLEVERFMTGKLSELYPDIGFVGEEFGGDRELSRYWLMDPIDGTAHFIRGMPFCTSMLALIENGEVTFSVIYDFINDAAYYAEKGQGAYMNGERIYVSERDLSQSYYTYEIDLKKPGNLELLGRFFGNGIQFKTISAGWEFIQIAEGKLEARICVDAFGKDYDFAPGTLLVSEAGGIVRTLEGAPYTLGCNTFIAGNKAVYTALREGPFSFS